MADTKITGLTALAASAQAAGDLIEVVDVSDTTMAATGTNKKMTLADFYTGVPADLSMAAGKFILETISAGLTANAGGGGVGSALALTSAFNEVSTCATAGDSVSLPTAVAKLEITIVNNGVAACDVYPFTSDDLGAGVDTAVSLPVGASITYRAIDTTTWVPMGMVGGGTMNGDLTILGELFAEHLHITDTATAIGDHLVELTIDAAGFGDVHAIETHFATGILADGEDMIAHDIEFDDTGSTGGNAHGLVVSRTATGSASIGGLKVNAEVDVIDQDSGTFGNVESFLIIAVDKKAEANSATAGDLPYFLAQDDTITIGSLAKFGAIDFVIDTGASGGGIAPTFEYSTGASSFDDFTPIDNTSGWKHTGTVNWVVANLVGWVVDSNTEFTIRVKRNRVSLSTEPVGSQVQVASTAVFGWDKSGNISVNTGDFAGDVTMAQGAQILIDAGPSTAPGLADTAEPLKKGIVFSGTGSSGQILFAIDGTSRFYVDENSISAAGSANAAALQRVTPSATIPGLLPNRDDPDSGIGIAGADQPNIVAGGINAVTWEEASNHILVRDSVYFGLTANSGGGGVGAALQLLSSYNELSTVAADGDSVNLPTAVAGYEVTIINNGANAADVYPFTSDDLGAGVDTAVSLPAGASITYRAIDATNWNSMGLNAGGLLTGEIVGADNTISGVNLKDVGMITNAIGDTGGGAQDIDIEDGNVVTATQTVGTTTYSFLNPTASPEGCSFTFKLVNGASNGGTVWPGSVTWVTPNGVTPTLQTSGTDILSFFTVDEGTTWYGYAGGRTRTLMFSSHAKVGATGGWVLGAANDLALMATIPQSQTNSTLIVPISGLEVGETITAFSIVGQIESGGNNVTIEGDLRVLTAAAADVTDASVDTLTTGAQTAQFLINVTKSGISQTVASGETYYIRIKGNTGATTDAVIIGTTVTLLRT